jgi:putative ABC transport system ATP-binding protein
MLTVTALEKAYRTPQGPQPVLRGVDLSVAPGESVAIMGESGSGKSTLLHLIGGLDHADSGSIRLDDLEITTLKEDGRAQSCGARRSASCSSSST